VTPADELRTAADKLRPAPTDKARLVLVAVPASTADKFTPLGGALADLLDTAAEYLADDAIAHPTHLVRALAVARQINGGQQP
jgi:hypothetical protein